MNILYFSDVRLPSAHKNSLHTIKMAEAFANSGHYVELHAKKSAFASVKKVFKYYKAEQKFQIRLMPFTKIPVYTSTKPLRKLSKRKLRVRKPDLVYGHNPVALAFFCPLDIPIILETDAIPMSPHKKLAFNKLIRQSNFRGIVTQSDALKKRLLKRYHELSGEQIFVAHDGADLREYIAAQNKKENLLQGRPDVLKIGYAGSLYPGKGVEIIERIAAICPEFDFHVIGGTRWQLQRYLTKKLPTNFFLYGFKNHTEIPAYLKTFDIVLAPYQHHALIKTGENVSRWVSPMKLFEYMAAEKPIICSHLPIITEILADKKNALLVTASDEHQWAQKIRYLHQHPEIAKTIAENAFQELKEKYTWDKRAAAIMGFFARSEQIQKHVRYMEKHTAEVMKRKHSNIRM